MNNKTALQGRFAGATARASSARFAALVNLHGRTRSRRHLHPVFLAAERVSNIVVVGVSLAGNVFATLHILGRRLLTAPDVGAHGAAGNCAANRRDVIAAPVADLVAENTADYGTDHGAWDVIAAFSLDLLLLDPAF